MRRTLALITTLALAGAAQAETGGAGFLPRGERAPSGYKQVDGQRGLKLLKPPASVACNEDGEAGAALRLYAGVKYTSATKRRGVTALRVGLYRSNRTLISKLGAKPSARFRYIYLDRLGATPATACGNTYIIRYTFRLDGKRPSKVVSYFVNVRPLR